VSHEERCPVGNPRNRGDRLQSAFREDLRKLIIIPLVVTSQKSIQNLVVIIENGWNVEESIRRFDLHELTERGTQVTYWESTSQTSSDSTMTV
jgi:hypothetical protein